jgi:DNA-binding XRE family transcriptional regulator
VVRAGEILAILDSGKTTPLNTLAHRIATAGATTIEEIFTNGQKIDFEELADPFSYVEQEYALTA